MVVFLYEIKKIANTINGDIIKNEKYERIAKDHQAPNPRLKNAIVAFIVGGIIGLIGEGIIELICYYTHISRNSAGTIMIVILIFIASLSTALGFFDKLVTKFKCGLLIPITGFAHSMTSAALDYRKEGPIYGLGGNIFKVAAAVILYGIIAAWFFGMIRFFLGGRV